ncbi:MAG: 6-phosphofructokinase [Roseburia sp.]|uniref:6-phosphofructokinase n=1 Tax=Roseburia sp. 831b TaxID=1261635 RepID=UPI000952040A|nr:6-phosphofructokinase [Roseburia sp. 831b]MCI5918110.1 6-phosphofructokinase [Roseburia sp.]MDD6217002.1 6-phosphofructokinase [Roseburia sp.]MDY5884097.1 6-phosphofructokinase [Roseburia sp.]WVK71835.1 6-phosphofructokinase [Roseburia sp. 831b]
MSKKNCMVAQSGGPTVAINSSLAGVITGVVESQEYDTIYGSVNGILGILNERYLNLTEEIAKKDGAIDTLITTPAMFLGSCRYKLPNYLDDDSSYVYIFNQFEKLNIGAFFYIGGNDSMDTVLKLSEYAKRIGSDVKILGIPKTIDNDLCETDHTPGFGSAAKYVASSILEIAHDTFIYAVKSVTIIEVMGRDAGWLTAASALARNEYNVAPHLIYLPEAPFDKDDFLLDVKKMLFTCNNVIVAVSEGIRDREGNYISASEQSVDTFGHSQLSGAGKTLEFLVKEKLGVKVRSVELNVLQRCASHLASKTDLEEAFALGKKAVALAEQNITASMVTMNRTSNNPYTIEYGYAEIKNIANEAKSVPREWINDAGNDIEQPLVDYLTPLIQGESQVQYKNGLPAYLNVSHLAELQ